MAKTTKAPQGVPIVCTKLFVPAPDYFISGTLRKAVHTFEGGKTVERIIGTYVEGQKLTAKEQAAFGTGKATREMATIHVTAEYAGHLTGFKAWIDGPATTTPQKIPHAYYLNEEDKPEG